MRQKDIAEEFNVTAMQVGRLRKKHVPDSEYNAKTGELSLEAIDILRTLLRGNDPTEPRFIECQVIRQVENKKWCHARAIGEEFGVLHVGIPPEFWEFLTVGKKFKAQMITTYEGENNEIQEIFYRHEELERRDRIAEAEE